MKGRTAVLSVVLALASGCGSEPALLRQAREEKLIAVIQQTLLASVEAEKSAVLATTDEESTSLADESKRLTTEIDRLRGELRPLIVADQNPAAVKKLDAFDAAWADFVKIDQGLLALAVANTNLKAARLTAREGAAALDRFVAALTVLQSRAADPELIRALSRASVSALNVQALLLVHIPAPEAAEMTGLEQRMDTLSGEVDKALAQLGASGLASAEEMTTATAAWSEYRRILADVVRLSRQNTNVFSFDVSVHEKRTATRQCLAALGELAAVVESAAKPTR